MTMILHAFDSLKSYDQLKAAGLAEKEARAIVGVVEEATQTAIQHLPFDAVTSGMMHRDT